MNPTGVVTVEMRYFLHMYVNMMMLVMFGTKHKQRKSDGFIITQDFGGR